jgi:hypothetical protein
MTRSETSTGVEQVAALVAERVKYEGWIAALEARADAAPAHVLERVRADYSGRLADVTRQLAAHRETLEGERTRVEGRLAELDGDLQRRSDERAELELRAAVGELAESDSAGAIGAVDEELAALRVQRGALSVELERLSEYLSAAAESGRVTDSDGSAVDRGGAAASEESPAPAATAAPTRNTPVPDAPAQAAPAQAAPAQAAPAAEAPAAKRASQETPAPAAAASDAATSDSSFTAVPVASLSARPVDAERPAASAPASSAAEPAPSQPPPDGPRRSSPFDELRFLNSIVGEGDRSPAAPPRQSGQLRAPRMSGIVRDSGETSALDDVAAGSKSRANETPLAANVPGNTPIRLRPSGATEQPKTLRCAQCGSMNYPTEWYCERCGAELAAL